MPPPPPTKSIIAGGGENGFKAPKPNAKGITTILLIAFTAFHFFYWLIAPAAALVLGSYIYLALDRKKKKDQRGTDREHLNNSDNGANPNAPIRATLNHHPAIVRIYIAISNYVVSSWFETVSALLEGFVGINFTYIVVASKPATEESTAALEAEKKAETEVDTTFLTRRKEGEGEDGQPKQKNTLLTHGKKDSASSSCSSGFVDGVSPKAQKVFNLTRPITAIDIFKPPMRGRVNIIVLNHRCRLDWMMLWPFMSRALGAGATNASTTFMNPLAALRIIMKQDMAYIPFLGWCTQAARMLFLRRRWEEDEANMKHYMRYLTSDADEQSSLLIFPEGTDFCPSAIERSHKFAKDNGRPIYNYVLHPRTTGLLAMKNAIGTDKIDRIIDVTIAYADRTRGDRTNDVHLLGGAMPSEISFIAESFVFEDNVEAPTKPDINGVPPPMRVPTDDLGFKEWIEARWQQKEKDMAKYYGGVSASSASYGWDCQKDIEGEQWIDGKQNVYDRFVVGGTMDTSIYNKPSLVVPAIPSSSAQSKNQKQSFASGMLFPPEMSLVPNCEIGTFKNFFFNSILAGGVFGGNGRTGSVYTFLLKPLVNFGTPIFIYHMYCPFLASSWLPFILTNSWIFAVTLFFVIYLQKMAKATFDQKFLFSELTVPKEIIEACEAREKASTLPPPPAPAATTATNATATSDVAN